MLYLYTDGGVILKNPSKLGGTWAWVLVNENDEMVFWKSNVIVPSISYFPNNVVTNNQTELLAIVNGLSYIHNQEISDFIEVRSDSEISLGRVFKGYSFNNIPTWLLRSLLDLKNLLDFSKFTYTLMDGHPTKEQVEKGIGKKGHITSKWNVWCDKECGRQAQKFLAEHNQ